MIIMLGNVHRISVDLSSLDPAIANQIHIREVATVIAAAATAKSLVAIRPVQT
jgi:hypothetical protein